MRRRRAGVPALLAAGLSLAAALPAGAQEPPAGAPAPDRAAYLAAAGRKTEAAALLTAYCAQNPGDLGALDLLGRVRLATMDTDGAATAYRAILAQDPGSFRALAQLSDALLLAGRFEELDAAYRQFLARAPGHAAVERARAELADERAASAAMRARHRTLGALAAALALGWTALLVAADRAVARRLASHQTD